MIPLCELFTTPDQVVAFLMLPIEKQDAVFANLAASGDPALSLACHLIQPSQQHHAEAKEPLTC